MGGIHTETTSQSSRPPPVKCEACGKILEGDAYTVSITLTSPDAGCLHTVEALVCNEACGKKYMLRVKHTLMLNDLKVDRVM